MKTAFVNPYCLVPGAGIEPRFLTEIIGDFDWCAPHQHHGHTINCNLVADSHSAGLQFNSAVWLMSLFKVVDRLI